MRGNTKHIGNAHPPRHANVNHFGNDHPAPRATHHKPIAGQTDKKTGHSPLSRMDHDSQTHHAPEGGHWRETSAGYPRVEHHRELIKNHK